MTLKEAFHYQNFLDSLCRSACYSISDKEHALRVEEHHLKNRANPDAQDETKTVEAKPFYPNDTVIKFLNWVIEERRTLSHAIGNAKENAKFGHGIDIDAELETNRFRQRAANSIKSMLANRPSVSVKRGQDYKFSNEGIQSPYYYDVEVSYTENFDRNKSRSTMASIFASASEMSTKIEQIMVNTYVDYEPTYDVNDSFEDVMERFSETAEES